MPELPEKEICNVMQHKDRENKYCFILSLIIVVSEVVLFIGSASISVLCPGDMSGFASELLSRVIDKMDSLSIMVISFWFGGLAVAKFQSQQQMHHAGEK